MEDLMQEIYDLFTNSMNRQISRAEHISNLRTFLDILNPDLIYQQMVQGANTYLQSRFQETVSDETFVTINAALDNLQETGSQLVLIWNALDHYEKYEIWDGVDENEISGSAFWGAVVGSVIFPGVGTFLGAMFGQASSYARIEAEVEAITKHYADGVAHFIELFQKCVAELLVPIILEDIHRVLQQIEEAEKNAALPIPDATAENYLSELERLAELRQQGHLSWWEYRKKKRQILARA